MDVGKGVQEQEGPLLSRGPCNEGHRLGGQLGGQVLQHHRLLHHLHTVQELDVRGRSYRLK